MQHLGLLSILTLVGGLVYLVRRWDGELSKTFSQTAANNRSSYFFYIGLFGIALPILYVFFAYWFAPQYQLPAVFVLIAGVSMMAQFVCTFFPDNGSWTTLEHRALTGISGVLLLPLLVVLLFVGTVPTEGKILAGMSLAVMAWLLSIALRNQDGYRYAMLLQVGYYVSFFVPIFYLTYAVS